MRGTIPRVAAGTALILILCCCTQEAGRLDPAVCPPSDRGGHSAALSGVECCQQQTITSDIGKMAGTVTALEKVLVSGTASRHDVLVELARICFALGEAAEKEERLQWYEKGHHYAEFLCRERPAMVEGHYWLALNLCGITQLGGAGQALALLPLIVESLESALAIDKFYDQGGPARVLGYIRYKAPPWPLSEGNMKQSLVLLRTAAEIAPHNSTNHLYLAETLIQMGEDQEACIELRRALSATCHATSQLGLQEDREQAISLLTSACSAHGKTPPEKSWSLAGFVKRLADRVSARIHN